MKYVITENQLSFLIQEQPDSKMPWQIEKHGYKKGDPNSLKNALKSQSNAVQSWTDACMSNRLICSTLIQTGLWFIPYVGPYLSTSFGMYESVRYIKQGDTTLGIIGLVTSPLMLNKSILILKYLNPRLQLGADKLIKILTFIHKTGLPLFYSKGMEHFYQWMIKKFGPEFTIAFKRLIASDETVNEYSKVLESKVKPKIDEWVKNNPDLYNKLTPVQKMAISS